MPKQNFDRLTAMDASFLVFESETCPLHVSATLVYEAGAMKRKDGGIDVDRYRNATNAILHRVPRYRQKLQWIPVVQHPVWVDDPEFNIDYHIRHTSLPRPGSTRQLKELSARIMAQPLDHSKPLWESWLIEGLEGDRFAIISKFHHCMIDGASGQELALLLMSPDPEHRVKGNAPRFAPRRAPTDSELLRSEVDRYAGFAARSFQSLTQEAGSVVKDLGNRIGAFRRAFSAVGEPTSESPLNGTIGPHRRFDWLDMPLEGVKQVRRALGCTVNDVVLAIVAGAVREFVTRRGVSPATLPFRVATPVSIRSEDERGELGNRVSQWYVELPIDEDDPMKRVERIQAATRELKESNSALDADAIMDMVEWTPTVLMSLAGRAASGSAPYNLMVTNVPGPQFPLYMEGAKMLAQYAQVPLAEGTALGVALVSYDGTLCWGFNADYELLPDLDAFVRAIDDSYHELARAAGVTLEPTPEAPAEAPAGTSADAASQAPA